MTIDQLKAEAPALVARCLGKKPEPAKASPNHIETMIHQFAPTIPAEVVRAIRAERARGETIREIANRHGVSTGYVCRVARGNMRREVA